ncbi:MAG: PAS domain-containing sensor histidine kinase [Candidatus Levybacteria bacterium]|nr:PAS domain-containing sensor histidine kinase [Candidatus Levybacteria bacterium]
MIDTHLLLFKTIFAQSPISTQIFTPDGETILVNKAWEKLWNIRFPELKSYNILNDQQLVETSVMTAIKKGFKGKIVDVPAIQYFPEKTVSVKNAVSDRWVAAKIFPIKNAKGKITHIVLQHTDVSQEKKVEQDKNDFIGIATHELKTPVTSLKAYAEVLEKKFAKNGDMFSSKQLGKMNAQLDKLTMLISDLLDATKIESGKLRMHQEKFDFDAFVVEIVEEMQRTTFRHTLHIEGKTKQKVQADRERTGQVLTNLISNAIKYSPHTEKIIIKQSIDSENVRLCVQDFGIGIPENNKERLFERFYRISGPKENTFPGLGLGLYISNEIMKRQKGLLWVESELGKGSTFCFTLPINAKIKNPQNNVLEEEIQHD